MNRTEYYRGKPNTKYGIWNGASKQFQFGISEDTPFLAIARLYQKIGDDAKKARFEPKKLPEKRSKVPRYMIAELQLQTKMLTDLRQHLIATEKENTELKGLLKAAINDIYKECSCNTCGCDRCEHNRETCDYDDRFTWRHKDEALALIGEGGDSN